MLKFRKFDCETRYIYLQTANRNMSEVIYSDGLYMLSIQ
jgi:hypothetical protein